MMSSGDIFALELVIVGIAAGLIFTIGIYVLQSAGFARVGQRLDPSQEKGAYWIPFYRWYLISSLAFTQDELDKQEFYFEGIHAPTFLVQWWFLLRIPAICLLSIIPALGSLAGMALDLAVKSFIYTRLYVYMSGLNPYEQMKEKMVLGIFSGLIPIIPMIVLLAGDTTRAMPIRNTRYGRG